MCAAATGNRALRRRSLSTEQQRNMQRLVERPWKRPENHDQPTDGEYVVCHRRSHGSDLAGVGAGRRQSTDLAWIGPGRLQGVQVARPPCDRWVHHRLYVIGRTWIDEGMLRWCVPALRVPKASWLSKGSIMGDAGEHVYVSLVCTKNGDS